MRKQDELSSKASCIAHAHPKEMVFVLLGRDPAAPLAIRAWADERVRLGKNKETDEQIAEARACAGTMEKEGRKWVGAATHYPEGMGEESRRLHREYNALVAAQIRGEMNGYQVRALTDECEAKGIILVPNGENLFARTFYDESEAFPPAGWDKET